MLEPMDHNEVESMNLHAVNDTIDHHAFESTVVSTSAALDNTVQYYIKVNYNWII